MRTTVTLDPDVEQLLRAAMQSETLGADEAPFVVYARRMGLRAGLDAGRLNQVADELETEDLDELSRTLWKTLGESSARQWK